jgi:hypothetical protein
MQQLRCTLQHPQWPQSQQTQPLLSKIAIGKRGGGGDYHTSLLKLAFSNKVG